MNYFAYGSNMSLARMHSRIPSAVMTGVYSLGGHCLRFHKVGLDGSAKCDAYFTGVASDVVFGVLYTIAPHDVGSLDAAEGHGNGYDRQEVEVSDERGRNALAFAYFATKIDESLRPFTWYKYHVVAGAIQHGLSDDYVALIERIESIADPDVVRARLELATHES